MRKTIDFSGFNEALITYYYKEVEAIKCDLLKADEQGNIYDSDKDIVFQKGQYPFELSDIEKQELIKYYYGDESVSMAE